MLKKNQIKFNYKTKMIYLNIINKLIAILIIIKKLIQIMIMKYIIMIMSWKIILLKRVMIKKTLNRIIMTIFKIKKLIIILKKFII